MRPSYVQLPNNIVFIFNVLEHMLHIQTDDKLINSIAGLCIYGHSNNSLQTTFQQSNFHIHSHA